MVLLAILVFSYRQVIDAYPGGGGAYAVSRANLGPRAGLVAAAALVVDYTLTVAVSIAAGVASLTSAFPGLSPATVPICLGILTVVTIFNLRGLGDAARAFLLPTMAFIIGLLAVIVVGLIHPLALHATQPGRSLLPTYGVEAVSVLSQIIAAAVGRNWAYFAMSLTITVVLALAANTSFGGLPVLASLLARDHFLPHLFSLRDDRQVLAPGILTLAILSGALLVAVGGSTQTLIPLFAIGVFTAIHRYYDRAGQALGLGRLPPEPAARPAIVVVPVVRVSRRSQHALAEALSISEQVIAVTVVTSDDGQITSEERALREEWDRWSPGPPLQVLRTSGLAKGVSKGCHASEPGHGGARMFWKRLRADHAAAASRSASRGRRTRRCRLAFRERNIMTSGCTLGGYERACGGSAA